jgi:hypothetical protein
MVQILEDFSPQSQRMEAFAKLFGNIGEGGQALKGALDERRTRRSLAEQFGEQFQNIRNPDLQRLMLQSHFQKEQAESKRKEELQDLQKAYPILEKRFGKDTADLITSFGAGGQTAILQDLLKQEETGERLGDILGGESPPEDVIQADVGELVEPLGAQESNRSKLNLPDYTTRPKGFTRKQWVDQRAGWSKKNTESLDVARDRLKGNKRDVLGTKKLQQINDSHELPEGLQRFTINPKTGEIYGLAQLAGKAPTAAQEWVKEIARFGNRAKDAYGSRVTNFDLAQYMKQFPSLLNTHEGRRNILRMMEINYELDSLYDRSVQRIIDQKGAGNIPPDEVDRLVRFLIKDREEQLFDEYLNLEQKNDSAFMKEGLESQRPSLEEIFGG